MARQGPRPSRPGLIQAVRTGPSLWLFLPLHISGKYQQNHKHGLKRGRSSRAGHLLILGPPHSTPCPASDPFLGTLFRVAVLQGCRYCKSAHNSLRVQQLHSAQLPIHPVHTPRPAHRYLISTKEVAHPTAHGLSNGTDSSEWAEV